VDPGYLAPDLNGVRFAPPSDLYADWAEVYDCFQPDRSREVDSWAGIAAPHGQRVLDLMCGTAEVSLGLARRGFHVVGVDLSPTMLAVGSDRLGAAADFPARSLSLVQAEACHLPACAGAFDFALVGGSGSFNHLDAAQALAALREIGRVLRPGGAVGAELVNPHLLGELEPARTFGALRPTEPGVSLERVCTSRYERRAGRFRIHQTTRLLAGGEAAQQSEESFALHVWEPNQMAEMLDSAGFRRVRILGGLDLSPFGRWSSDLLVLAQRNVPAES
jgi:ubiquinone/menaquinone biosynthesis C-methylase UbiE